MIAWTILEKGHLACTQSAPPTGLACIRGQTYKRMFFLEIGRNMSNRKEKLKRFLWFVVYGLSLICLFHPFLCLYVILFVFRFLCFVTMLVSFHRCRGCCTTRPEKQLGKICIQKNAKGSLYICTPYLEVCRNSYKTIQNMQNMWESPYIFNSLYYLIGIPIYF